jgi:hypothetical protein
MSDGSYKTVEAFGPAKEMVQVDVGGSIRFVDKNSIPAGTSYTKGLAPQIVGSADTGFFVYGGSGGAGGAATGTKAPAPAAGAPSAESAPGARQVAPGMSQIIPGTSFKNDEQLRGEFTRNMEPFVKLAQAFEKVQVAALNPSGAGDISLIYGYMKILDPGSTVMQGEQATAANAGGVSDRVRAMYNKALTGETLADNVRQDFYAQSRNLIESQRPLQQDISERYGLIATQNKLDPNQIVFDPFKRIRTPAEIAAEAAKEKDKKKKPASYNNTYNLLPRN